ncbi:MAG TPA: DUF3300 domain-containing protein [Bryobacteraceae bacterium]|nr:DUF3300 domain-containing protein [Bryobacteraceae bacterium]
MQIRKVAPILAMATFAAAGAFAQAPPFYPPGQLNQLVAPIALYPDPLLAQVLAAATYPDQIPDAARWADEHHYLTGPDLANAIQADQLPWDPSVQALLPFPTVLDTMAGDMNWTTRLGDAFLTQQQDVMNAVQRERRKARDFGYLRSNGQIVVSGGPYITIVPARPAFVVVPYYDPAVVYVAPRPGFAIAGAIRLGFGVTVGAVFRPWGWGYNRVDWGTHVVVINNAPWRRTWTNRRVYVHPYTEIRRVTVVRPAEHHDLHEISKTERADWREGRKVEEHKEKDRGKHRGEDRGRGRGRGHDR